MEERVPTSWLFRLVGLALVVAAAGMLQPSTSGAGSRRVLQLSRSILQGGRSPVPAIEALRDGSGVQPSCQQLCPTLGALLQEVDDAAAVAARGTHFHPSLPLLLRPIEARTMAQPGWVLQDEQVHQLSDGQVASHKSPCSYRKPARQV